MLSSAQYSPRCSFWPWAKLCQSRWMVFHGMWLGFAAKLAMETGMCYWLGLHGLQVASAWRFPLLHPPTYLAVGEGILGVLCLVRRRGSLAAVLS